MINGDSLLIDWIAINDCHCCHCCEIEFRDTREYFVMLPHLLLHISLIMHPVAPVSKAPRTRVNATFTRSSTFVRNFINLSHLEPSTRLRRESTTRLISMSQLMLAGSSKPLDDDKDWLLETRSPASQGSPVGVGGGVGGNWGEGSRPSSVGTWSSRVYIGCSPCITLHKGNAPMRAVDSSISSVEVIHGTQATYHYGHTHATLA
jgi:hypothetical protein